LYLRLNHKIAAHLPLTLVTHERSMQIDMQSDNNFSVNMGKPEFSPAALPMTLAEQKHYDITIEGKRYSFSAVSLGNPHAVLLVEDVKQAPVATVGKAICHHEVFPKEVNVGFMQIIDKHHIALRVYERGVGETQACGSGACAAAVIAIRDGYCQSPVTVKLLGGELIIHWQGRDLPVWMQGDAVYVYAGCI
jgi:diaminopimelate epimerase